MNVDFIQGDFTEEAVVDQLLAWLGGEKFDLIISDIAPNITGIDSADQAASMYFLELALDTVGRRRSSPAPTSRRRCSRVGVGSIREGSAQVVREGRDPQARRIARAVARGLHRREGIQGLSRSRAAFPVGHADDEFAERWGEQVVPIAAHVISIEEQGPAFPVRAASLFRTQDREQVPHADIRHVHRHGLEGIERPAGELLEARPAS